MDRPEENDPEFEALIAFVQESRGVDFRGYKRTSLRRRITLRLNELGLDSFAAYYSFLEAHPQEFTNLLNTVLINVTSFFRDPEAWDALRRQVVPAIIGHNREREIRLWSVGCATGQEAYSLAMALAEPLGIGEFCRRVKIYATDLDEPALEVARHATYTLREVESVPPELLDKYFERVNYHYVFHRELRKCVIFGRHNVVRDAPISRIELLLCRNLLIYLETETQNIVLPRLHYALKDHGYLFLGRAETQLARSRLFQSVDMRSRIFMKVPQEWRRTPAGGLVIREGELPGESSRQLQIQDAIANSSAIAYLAIDAEGRLVFANPAARRMLDVGEADVGRPFQDLSISYRPTELRSRIEEAQQQGRPIKIENQEWPRGGGESLRLSIEVTPILGRENKPFITLVAFSDSTQVFQLQQELEAAQESLETTVEELQSANEELETTNEELQSTNEELETTNEELQSTNEELETINEELRSSNEELEAANEELRSRSEEFAQYRRYVESVLGSFDAGVIVLDRYGTAQFWNRWCENIFGLRSDEVVQRSFFDLDIGLPVHKLREPFERVAKGQETFSRINLQGIDRRGRNMKCA
ncbi:MAG: PAS domain-containing protein, partial [Acetobacteraceae bacterium]|nr:PAS domain-containing protein [Acetobacteraceae bacterium]